MYCPQSHDPSRKAHSILAGLLQQPVPPLFLDRLSCSETQICDALIEFVVHRLCSLLGFHSYQTNLVITGF